jgi:predicted amidophosphoribosyltransferase
VRRPPHAARRLLGLLAPPLCLCCRCALPRAPRGPALCDRCRAELDRTRGFVLVADGLDAGFAALPYDGAGRRLVAALKFSRLLVAAELGAALIAARLPWRAPTTIVPVPAAPLRLLTRGFDPAEQLAGSLAGATGGEVATVLRRRDLRRQRGRARSERIARPPAIVMSGAAPPAALLIDDVVTTGATLSACAAALRAGGCHAVVAATLAAVPPARASLARARHGGVAWAATGHRVSERSGRADRDRRT